MRSPLSLRFSRPSSFSPSAAPHNTLFLVPSSPSLRFSAHTWGTQYPSFILFRTEHSIWGASAIYNRTVPHKSLSARQLFSHSSPRLYHRIKILWPWCSTHISSCCISHSWTQPINLAIQSPFTHRQTASPAWVGIIQDFSTDYVCESVELNNFAIGRWVTRNTCPLFEEVYTTINQACKVNFLAWQCKPHFQQQFWAQKNEEDWGKSAA